MTNLYYSVQGTNSEWVVPIELDNIDTSGWMLMNGPRPDVDYHSTFSGEWVKGPSQEAIDALTKEVKDTRIKKIVSASSMIDALTLVITDDDVQLKSSLTNWLEYREALIRLDISDVQNVNWPPTPE